MRDLFTNEGATTVSSGGTTAPAQGTTESWTVASSASFPAAVTSTSEFFIADPALPTEIILVTNVSGTTWSVTRGADGSTPVAHTAGFTVNNVVPSVWLQKIEDCVSLSQPVTYTNTSSYTNATSLGATPARTAMFTSASLVAAKYYVEAWLVLKLSTATGSSTIDVNFSTTGTISSGSVAGEWYNAAASGTKQAGFSSTFTTAVTHTPSSTASQDRIVFLNGWVNLSVGGTVSLGVKQTAVNASSAVTITGETASFMRVTPIT